jgi:osmotically-inducible protein OsmY
VENHLATITGQWTAQQVRINSALVQVGALQNVSARVIGNQAYLWGEVNSESDKAWAARVASSFANLQVVNQVRVVPGPLFSLPSWL